MDLHTYVGLGAFPIVVGFVQLFKQGWPTLPSWCSMVAALVVAEAWSVALALVLVTDAANAALVGIVLWLMACGAWSAGKTALGK